MEENEIIEKLSTILGDDILRKVLDQINPIDAISYHEWWDDFWDNVLEEYGCSAEQPDWWYDYYIINDCAGSDIYFDCKTDFLHIIDSVDNETLKKIGEIAGMTFKEYFDDDNIQNEVWDLLWELVKVMFDNELNEEVKSIKDENWDIEKYLKENAEWDNELDND